MALTKFTYLIGQAAIPAITADAVATQALVARRLYIILDNTVGSIPKIAPAVPAGWTPTWVYRWASETQMALDVAAGLPPWLTVLMYDNELNTLPATPSFETDNPPLYMNAAAAVAHTAADTFIATGGLHTSNLSYPGGAAQEVTDLWNTAVHWDGYAIQSQTAINQPTVFEYDIQTQSQSITSVNPSIGILSVGVGDIGATGKLVGLPTIEHEMARIPTTSLTGLWPRTIVWMNFGPHSAPQCTANCPIPARYDMVVSLIHFFG